MSRTLDLKSSVFIDNTFVRHIAYATSRRRDPKLIGTIFDEQWSVRDNFRFKLDNCMEIFIFSAISLNWHS